MDEYYDIMDKEKAEKKLLHKYSELKRQLLMRKALAAIFYFAKGRWCHWAGQRNDNVADNQ